MNYLMGTAIVLAAAILVVLVLALASRKPDEFTVKRSKAINAPPEAIFPHINDLHQWEDWSPYLKKDPALKGTYSGPVSGIGSVYEFEGNKEVGKGRVTIIGSRPHSTIAMQLDMIEPFAASNTVEFTLKPDGNATEVTWSMTGKNNFLSKIIGVFLDMDKMISKDFDDGLSHLKIILEK